MGNENVLTETTRCYSGSNHDGAAARLEFGENPVTLLLLLVTVDGECRPAVLTEVLGDVVGDTLGAGEDDNLAVLLRDGFKVTDELALLLKLGADLDDLLDVVVGSKLGGTDVDLSVVVQEVTSETLDLLGPGGGEHERLSVRTDLLQDLANLGLETHVEHAIGLVHDKVGNAAEVGLAGIDHVDKTTGSGDADLGTTLEITDLRTLGNTTVNGGRAKATGTTEAVALDLDLVGELTSGSKDEGDRAVTGLEERLSVDVNHGGESETDGLTGTVSAMATRSRPAKGHRPSLGLNSRRGVEAELLDLRENVVGETSLVERGDGLGTFWPWMAICLEARNSWTSRSLRAATRGSSM